MVEGNAKVGKSAQGVRFRLVRIFTQSRGAAESVMGKREGFLRDGIFGGPFHRMSGSFLGEEIDRKFLRKARALLVL
jgi:hypothetical protein